MTVSKRSRLDFAAEVAKDSKEERGRCVIDFIERLACLLAKNAVGAVARKVFDADEAKTICRCVCESFVHELCMRRLIVPLRLYSIVFSIDRNS